MEALRKRRDEVRFIQVCHEEAAALIRQKIALTVLGDRIRELV